MRNKSPQKDAAGLAPRLSALALLQAVLAEGQMLSEATALTEPLSASERARAERLALTVLRHMGRADAVLKGHLAKVPPLLARNVLRLATVEMCHDGAAAHGVVDAAVRLMRDGRKTRHLAGLANAVLRKVAAQDPAIWAALAPDMMPVWLRRPLVHVWGRPAVAAMEAAHALGAPLDITPKRAADAARLASDLGAEHLPTGSLRLAQAGQVSALPGFAAGDWWVQDAAAALPARCLGDVAGQDVLDICAAPGGKTMQLAAAGARVTALDISGTRMARLAENLARTGLAADTVVADALHWEPATRFAAILLDAPCSATGTVRRHPDLVHAKSMADVAALTELQASLLDHAAALLAPGGRLVWCTCSLLPEEGEAQVAAVLERNPALKRDSIDAAALGLDADAADGQGGLRLRPDFWAERGGMDGFHIACLARD